MAKTLDLNKLQDSLESAEDLKNRNLSAKELSEELRVRRELREELAYEAALDEKAKGAESSLRMIEKQIQDQKYSQDNCDHLKENGKKCIGGQHNSSHVPVFLCLKCQKTWFGFANPEHNPNGLPQWLVDAHLMENVGG